ncbi:MAG: hypothetical protein V8R88_06340 [Faecalibacterium prausnitzii]
MDTDETKMQVQPPALWHASSVRRCPGDRLLCLRVMAQRPDLPMQALTAENIYTEIITANAQMDDAEVPASAVCSF